MPVVGELDLERAADRSVAMTGADISSIVMVALGLSLVDGLDALSQPLLDEAILRRNQVYERPARSAVDIARHAVHESGHAIYAALRWNPASVISLSVAESGENGGRTDLADDWHDNRELDRRGLNEKVGWALAGMVAEELAYGEDATTLGSAHDLSVATRLLLRLVGDVGGDAAISPVDIDALEAGNSSDRGAESMRSAVWEAVHARAVTALAETRFFLEPHLHSIRGLAERLQAADDLTLSGVPLRRAFLESGVGISPSETTSDG